MRRNSTAVSAVRRSTVLLGLSIAVCLGLAGCDSLDDALFGTETPEQSQAQAPAQAPAPAAEGQLAAGTMPGSPEGTMPGGGAEAATAPVAGITPVAIEQGSDTGTAVNHTIQVLRSQVSGIQDVIIAAAQKLAELKGGAAQSSTQYHEAKALIAARLQLGTTRGNPELVAQWNNAQAGLELADREHQRAQRAGNHDCQPVFGGPFRAQHDPGHLQRVGRRRRRPPPAFGFA